MRFSATVAAAFVACLASSVVADIKDMYAIPLYRRDHPEGATSIASAALPAPTDAGALPTSGKVTYTNSNNVSVIDNYSPTPENYAMDNWVCIEDTGMNDPAWADLDCSEEVMDDWECDYDPIAPPVNPTSPPVNGGGSVVSTVAAGGSPPPVATVPPTGSGGNILNGANPAIGAGRSAVAGVAVAVAAVALSML
ncbi:hypothetical protein HDU67_004630 [Dinochytrium kinnereticum]|nr:hypothetical protein HDU67_004630 [Dinochytrium kinnereticum]